MGLLNYKFNIGLIIQTRLYFLQLGCRRIFGAYLIHANSTDLGADLPILSRLKRLTTLHTTSTTFLQF